MPSFTNPFDMRRFAGMIGQPQQAGNPLMRAYRGIDFGGNRQNQMPDQPPQPEEPPDPLTAALARMQGGQAAGAYRQHLANMPDPAKLAPSQGRRIGAALAAAAGGFQDPRMGLAIGEQIRDAPYRGALENWQMKGAGLKEQADIEQQDVKGQLEYIKAIRDQQQKEREFGLNKRKVDIDEEQAQTNRIYREAQIKNMKSEGWKEQTNEQGHTILYKVGEQPIDMGPSIEGRKVRDQERGTDISAYNAQTSRGQLGVSQGNLAVNQGQLGLAGEKFGYQQGQDAIGNAFRERTTNVAERNAGAAGYVSPTDQYNADNIALMSTIKEHPEWGNWVTTDDNGAMQIKKPGDYWGPQGMEYNPSSDPNYATFLEAIKTKKQQILGTRHPGIGGMGGPGVGRGGVPPVRFQDLPK